MKWLVGFPAIKGVILGLTTVAVVHAHGLGAFAQALIIALVSALIGALGIIGAAIISARSAEQLLKNQEHMTSAITDVQRAVDAARRKDDPSP